MFKIKLSFEQSISISSKILNINIYDILNEELINYYSTPGELINLINFSNKYKIDLKLECEFFSSLFVCDEF